MNDDSFPEGRWQTDLDTSRRIFEQIEDEDVDLDSFDEASDVSTFGPYLILQELGSGGTADVYQAVRRGTHRAIALKIFRRADDDPALTSHVMRELDLLSTINDPGVPKVHDFGREDGQLYLATDYIEGISIDEFCHANELPMARRVRLMVKVARIVQRLNERGIVHRDIKPANILVDLHGEPVVIDFGIGDFVQPGRGQRQQPLGTVAFMAPEQAIAEKAASTRTDVYGLAAMLLYLLTGKTPLPRDSKLEMAVQRLKTEPARDPRDIDPTLPIQLAAVLRKALSFEQDDRYASAAEFADDLERFLNFQPVAAERPGPWTRMLLLGRRRPGVIPLASAAVLLVLLAVGSLGWGYSQVNLREEAEAVAAAQQDLRAEAERVAAEQESLRVEAEQVAREQEALRVEAERVAAEQEALRVEAERVAAEQEALAKERADIIAERDAWIAESKAFHIGMGETIDRLLASALALRDQRDLTPDEFRASALEAMVVLAAVGELIKEPMIPNEEFLDRYVAEVNEFIEWALRNAPADEEPPPEDNP